ncbi:MAG TPA: HAD family phosphatase [Erysipelotrichaceae bacterium]|nr:HAD family phosphatase [Erysipelotrichaceae bacterium]
MTKLLAVDLDGTLFHPRRIRRCISKKNVQFLHRWIDEGNKVLLVTSRSRQFTERLKDEIKRPFDCISCCSSQIVADDKLIHEKTMPNKKLEKILEKIDKNYEPLGFLMTTEKYSCVIKVNRKVRGVFLFFYRLWWWMQFAYREPYVVDNDLFQEELKTAKIYKVINFIGLNKNKSKISKELNKEFREEFPEIESSWTAQVNELTPKGCNKGNGVEKYCEIMNINPENVYVVGDSGNDISMFNKFYERSYCMKHGHPSARKYAKHIISRVYKLEKLILRGDLTINKSSEN